jgi:aspartyl-tRNA(Asn)/glutamyl-tRNA(Gln) amidotransferase subunit A
VAQCAAADATMANEAPWTVEPEPLAGLRIGIPQGLALRDLDATVSARFAAATAALTRAGARLSDETIPMFDGVGRVQAKTTFSTVEGYTIHRQWLETRAAEYDPNVSGRLLAARDVKAADYIDMQRARAELVRAMDARMADLDALVMPTVPIVAPVLSDVATPDAFRTANLLLLRNPALINVLDLCAISLPCPRDGGLPAGLMLVARNGQDKKLLRMAAAVERLFAA